MRRGELSVLEWGDLDWQTGVLTVERQVDAKLRVSILKTDAAARRVLLDEETLRVLEVRLATCKSQAADRLRRQSDPKAIHRRETQRAYREGKRAKAGGQKSARKRRRVAEEMPGEVPWIFAGTDGAQPNPKNLLKRVHQVTLASVGIGSRRMHDLRHTFSTVAIEEGIDPKTVSRRMGHTNVRMTMDTYVTTSLRADRALGKHVSEVFGRSEGRGAC